MDWYGSLKKIWKKLGVNGQVKNFSSVDLWVIDNDADSAVAHRLKPGFKTPIEVDTDAFKRVDGIAIEGHKNWWKIYDVSIAEIREGKKSLVVSAITKIAVDENHFGKPVYKEGAWGKPIRVVLDVKRSKKGRITQYLVSGIGWIKFEQALEMTRRHEIDNARPVFPETGKPYIRTRRDPDLFNNISMKG